MEHLAHILDGIIFGIGFGMSYLPLEFIAHTYFKPKRVYRKKSNNLRLVRSL